MFNYVCLFWGYKNGYWYKYFRSVMSIQSHSFKCAVKNNVTSHIHNNQVFPKAQTTPLSCEWSGLCGGSLATEMSPYILITSSLLSAVLETLSTLRHASPLPGRSLSLWSWTGPLSRTSSWNFSGKLSIVSRLLWGTDLLRIKFIPCLYAPSVPTQQTLFS